MRLTIYIKNVQSISTERKFVELLKEIELFDWDIIILSEVWREGAEEVLDLPGGHIYLGSGGHKRERGVGILIH